MNRIMDGDCPGCGEPRTVTQSVNEGLDGTGICTKCSTECFGFMDGPLYREPDGLTKRVNEDHDEIWVCTGCRAVLFTYWPPSSMDLLRRALEPRLADRR